MHCVDIIFHLFVGSVLATVAESLINAFKEDLIYTFAPLE